jgi:ferredoxin
MEKNIIFYFSGTGNSLKAAKDVAEALGDTKLAFTEGGFDLADEYERVGFVFPSYAGSAPDIVVDFIKRLNFSAPQKYLFAVVTCRETQGNSSIAVNSALKPKGLSLSYSASLKTVGNYILEYPLQKNQDGILKNAEKRTADIAADIKNKAVSKIGKCQNPPLRLFHAVGNRFFRFTERRFYASDACAACGLCVKLCPVKNIQIIDKKPVFLHKNCTNCLACLHYCPQKAVECGKITMKKGRGRYHHAEISAGEMLKNRRIEEEK